MMSEFNSGRPLILKCGLRLPNRLVKASMSENIATAQRLPDKRILNVYRHWATGGWGLLITGNVQVDDRYLGTSTDLTLDSSLDDNAITETFSAWANECSQEGTPVVMQLNHPGRQCPIGAGRHGLLTKNLAPSAIGLDMGPGLMASTVSMLAFGIPREVDGREIDMIVEKFARAAMLAAKSGFSGVEIHASHGYLLDQFLLKETNLRRDSYGGSAVGRAKLATDVIHAVRKALPAKCCVGVLVSAVESQEGDSACEERLEQLRAMIDAGVDYVHVTGGTFEKPTMFLGPSLGQDEDTAGRMQPYFKSFSRIVKLRFPGLPVIVTGGFRDRASVEAALVSEVSDMVGLVRPAAVVPDLPAAVILNKEIIDESATFHHAKIEAPWIIRQVGVTALNVHMDNAWYLSHLRKM